MGNVKLSRRGFLGACSLALAGTALSACAQPAGVATPTSQPAEATQVPAEQATAIPPPTEAAVPKMSPFAPYSEPITLTCVRIANRGTQHAPGESGFDNGTLKAIEKVLNVKVKVLWETAPGDDYKTKLNLAIASDKLPDFFQVGDYQTFQALATNNKLADLTEAYNTCIGGRAAEHLKEYAGKQLINATFGGKVYGVPGVGDTFNHNLLWIRPDWLKKVDLPLPKTVDDVKNLAKAFVEKDPGGNESCRGMGCRIMAKFLVESFPEVI